MTTQERNMAVILGTVISVGVLGSIAWFSIIDPISETETEIETVSSQIKEMEDEIEAVKLGSIWYDKQKKLSLPANVDLARREYEILLNGLLRRAKFTPDHIKIDPLNPDTKNVPILEKEGPAGIIKTPAYIKIGYNVQVKGDLHSLVSFFELFYQQPILHQIRTFSVSKNLNATKSEKGNRELDISLVIEGTVIDGADNRQTLTYVPQAVRVLAGAGASYQFAHQILNSGKGIPYRFDSTLATKSRRYANITGKNLFFGPLPPQEEQPEGPPPTDISQYIKLVAISVTDDNKTAILFDLYNNHDYCITQSKDGSYSIEGYYFIGGKRKRFAKSKYLEYGDEESDTYYRFNIIKINDRDILLQEISTTFDKKVQSLSLVAGGGILKGFAQLKTYRLAIGDMVNNKKKLKREEILADLYETKAMPIETIPTKKENLTNINRERKEK